MLVNHTVAVRVMKSCPNVPENQESSEIKLLSEVMPERMLIRTCATHSLPITLVYLQQCVMLNSPWYESSYCDLPSNPHFCTCSNNRHLPQDCNGPNKWKCFTVKQQKCQVLINNKQTERLQTRTPSYLENERPEKRQKIHMNLSRSKLWPELESDSLFMWWNIMFLKQQTLTNPKPSLTLSAVCWQTFGPILCIWSTLKFKIFQQKCFRRGDSRKRKMSLWVSSSFFFFLGLIKIRFYE